MPDARNAVTIVTSVVVNPNAVQPYGTPFVLGESTYATKNTIKYYSSLTDVGTDHGTSSKLYKAVYSLWAQGIREVYVMSLQAATAGSPTATEIETALALIDASVSAGEFHGACLASITDTALLEKLQVAADRTGILFTATSAVETVANIVAAAASLSSVNGFFVAYKGSTNDAYDIAAAALGAIFATKPWYTMSWVKITCDVDEYFAPSEVASLELGHVNAIINEDDANRLSNGMSTYTTLRYLDITRTRYETESQIKTAIASARLAAGKVPYTAQGLEVVRCWIVSALEDLVTDGALSKYTVTMPVFANISEGDRASRILQGVEVSATLANDIQSFSLSLTITV
ncbi:MAG: hypothetical protein LUQ71_10285 [Methanoregula sp.]|nr:hypothetical protein [Methanoregula sp.]